MKKNEIEIQYDPCCIKFIRQGASLGFGLRRGTIKHVSSAEDNSGGIQGLKAYVYLSTPDSVITPTFTCFHKTSKNSAKFVNIRYKNVSYGGKMEENTWIGPDIPLKTYSHCLTITLGNHLQFYCKINGKFELATRDNVKGATPFLYQRIERRGDDEKGNVFHLYEKIYFDSDTIDFEDILEKYCHYQSAELNIYFRYRQTYDDDEEEENEVPFSQEKNTAI